MSGSDGPRGRKREDEMSVTARTVGEGVWMRAGLVEKEGRVSACSLLSQQNEADKFELESAEHVKKSVNIVTCGL